MAQTAQYLDFVERWGPIGYDLAIEYATLQGGCVIPATGTGTGGDSQYSRNVWKYYYEKRPDVHKEPLGDMDSYERKHPYLFVKLTKEPVLINKLKSMNNTRPGIFAIEKEQPAATTITAH